MNINSKEFVTIAQEIHTKEISTKDKIENKRTEVDQFHDTLESIRDHISYLEAARDAVEDSDEEESYKNKHIERLEAKILEAEMEELKAAKQLRAAENELFNKERDLESVLDEKAQTLFQVRERARKESDNSKTAGKMYGSVYSDIGASLQNHIQMNLMSLSQAASILDGSVEEFVESVGDSSNEVNLAGNGASISNSKDDFLTSPLSAFTLEEEKDSSLDGKMSSSSMKNRNLVISKDTAGNTGKTYLTNTYKGNTKRKVKSDNIDKNFFSQNISWSDIEYVDTSDKIKRANQNSKILEWKGEEGNSLRVPKNKSSQLAKILRDFGVEGISYINGDVDFSQVAKHEIKFVDAGTLYFALEKIIKVDNITSRKYLNEKIRGQWQKIANKQLVDKIIADDEFAKEFSAKTGMNTDVIRKQGDLRTELRRTGLTLHETADCKKIQIVSTTIHNAFKHYGGVSEMIERLLSGDIRGSL